MDDSDKEIITLTKLARRETLGSAIVTYSDIKQRSVVKYQVVVVTESGSVSLVVTGLIRLVG